MSSIHFANHLAAHAIVALRAEFRVEQIELQTAGGQRSGVTCDWKEARDVIR